MEAKSIEVVMNVEQRGVHTTYAAAMRQLAELAYELRVGDKLYARIMGREPRVGARHNQWEITPSGSAACTCTNFGYWSRRVVLGVHRTLETAARQYARIWDTYHKLHSDRVWLQLPDTSGNHESYEQADRGA